MHRRGHAAKAAQSANGLPVVVLFVHLGWFAIAMTLLE
jgi:hypothetical protein